MANQTIALGLQNKIDVYKLRAEEYRSRYENLRSLEWKVLFQVYAGYTAIALAFYHLPPAWNTRTVSWLAMFTTLAFYSATRYLSFRIQERLIVFDEAYEKSMAKIESASGAEPQALPDLGHKYYWTYHTQLALNTLTLFGLLAYEAATSGALTLPAAILLLVLGAASMRIGWLVRPKSAKAASGSEPPPGMAKRAEKGH